MEFALRNCGYHSTIPAFPGRHCRSAGLAGAFVTDGGGFPLAKSLRKRRCRSGLDLELPMDSVTGIARL